MSILSIPPDVVQSAPLHGTDVLPRWAKDVLAAVTEASARGETVRLDSTVETLTPAQTAERLGLSRATVSRRIAAGEIATIKVGNRHRIPVTEYQRFRRDLMRKVTAYYADDIEDDLT
ncbi:MAG: helix-turn-helix domain-containing protein [Micrococcales bacterium]|nr:helix-turn-helix domain-containing protein [Micrococcales bacterium]